MKRIEAKVSNEEYKQIQSYVKKKKISIWRLVKDSVLEKISKKSLDDFA